MKHFLIEITYTAEPERMAEVRPRHRDYVKAGFERGLFLFAGQLSDKSAGIVIARMHSLEEVDEFFAGDPYRLKEMADYRIEELNPVFHHAVLDEWVK